MSPSNTDDLAFPDWLEPPRKNGELQFDAPWQSRVFGLAVMLRRAGVYDWEELNMQPPAGDSPESVYQRWLTVLESLLIEKGVVNPQEIEARAEQFAASDHHHAITTTDGGGHAA